MKKTNAKGTESKGAALLHHQQSPCMSWSIERAPPAVEQHGHPEKCSFRRGGQVRPLCGGSFDPGCKEKRIDMRETSQWVGVVHTTWRLALGKGFKE